MARSKLECIVIITRRILIIAIIVVIVMAYKARKLHQSEVASQIPKNALKYIFFKKKLQSQPKSIESVSNLIYLYNQQENILNEDIYGRIGKDTVVFVVTVHKLSIYLEFLLVSLSQVSGIEKALIIFSHSYFDDDINDLIQSIDFARVLQIYYPYSVQMHPNKFPGLHPLGCPYYMNMKHAESLNCTGALSPDIHGRYRNPTQSEIKHHWWWTANTVFEILSCCGLNHTGTVIFLNDDVYLLQDFMFMILSMTQMAEFIPKYDFLSVDSVTDFNNFNAFRVDIKNWVPTDNPDVFAFDFATWNSIVSHYDLFCDFDDYSWARSLYYISLNRKDGPPYKVISTAVPRAFKTNKCGFASKLVDCDAIESVYQVLNLQRNMSNDMFPAYLEVYALIELEDEFESIDYTTSNGGWNDPRDKKLCRNITIKRTKTIY